MNRTGRVHEMNRTEALQLCMPAGAAVPELVTSAGIQS